MPKLPQRKRQRVGSSAIDTAHIQPGLNSQQAEGESMQRRRWATQAEMASRLGTVPDVVNRALRKLSEEGLIHVKRHQIQILDKEVLRDVA